MRKIWPDKEEIGSSLFPNGNDFVTKEELTKLVVRLDDLAEDFTILKDYLDKFISQLGETLTTKNINAINASIDEILAGIIKAKELSVEGKITANELEVFTNITTDYIKSVRAVLSELDAETINAKDVEFVNTHTNYLYAETVDIKNWSIENLKIETAEIDNLETKTIGTEIINTSDVQTDTIEAEKGNINEITSDKVVTGKLDTFEVKSSQFVWKELQEVVDQDRFYLELPHFENGTYYIKAITGSFDENNFEGAETLFTIESRNSVDNYFISWSQDELGYLERVYITTKENKLVYRIFNLRGKKLRILFANVSSTNVGAPNSFEDYDQQISASYVIEYKDGNKFFRPVDLFNDGVAVGVLSLDSTDVYNLANDDEVVYDTTENKRYTSYLPDQSLNTKDNVKFNSVDAPFLDITNATIKKRIRTPNIYNGPEVDLDTLANDTLYIPNKTETEYTGWAFKITDISEFTDNWQDACRGYDWSKTTYVGEELGFDQAKDVSEIRVGDVQHICVRGNTFYLMYGSTSSNTGNIATLSIDDTGAIELRKQSGTDKMFWVERAATNQINVANLQDYDEVWFGNMLDTDQYKIVYKNVTLFKGHEIPYKKVVDTNGIIYRKTNNGTEDAVAEIIPINEETKVQYEEGTPLTYDVETRELTADDDINIKNDLTVANKTTTKELEVEEDATIGGDVDITGDVTIGGTTDITGDTHIEGNLEVDGKSQFNDTVTLGAEDEQVDLHINGNIYQKGEDYETHAEQLYTKKDHIILREDAQVGLLNGEHSGLIITKYDGTEDLHLCTDNSGYAQVGINGESTYGYTFEDHNLFYDEENDKFYDDEDFEKEHEFYIPAGAEDVEKSKIPENDDTYTVRIKYSITESNLQRLLTVEKDAADQSLLYYDATAKEARAIEKPENQNTPLVPVLDGGRVTYREYSAGNDERSDAQEIFDDNRPIGSTYVQYPWQKGPNDLFNSKRIKTVWEAIKDYDGAFFRAEGGMADPFQEEPDSKRWTVVDTPLVKLFTAATTLANAMDSTNSIKSISEKPDGTYTIADASGVESSVAATTALYNFNIPIGTVAEVLNREQNWTVEIHDDLVINTTKTNVVLSSASAANPTTAQHQVLLTPIVNGTQTLATSESGVVTVLNNRTSLVYDKNISLGHVEGLYTKWQVKTTENDNYIATPLYENGDAFSMTNTANPTEAQTIVSVERVKNTTTYNVRFADGHTTNYEGTTAFYIAHTRPDGTRTATSSSQIAGIFHKWRHDYLDSNDFYWEFPETDEYVFTTANNTNPTDAQIITKIWGDWNNGDSGNGQVEIVFKDGHSTWYTYNGATIYLVDRNANTVSYVGLANMFQVHNEARWKKNSTPSTLYLANEDISLSVASAASPTNAQLVKYVYIVDANHYVVVRKDNTVSVYNTTGVSTTLYDKNTVWGSINAVKLIFEETEEDTYSCVSSVLKDNDGHFITGFKTDGSRNWYEYSDGGEVQEVTITNSLSVYDNADENYAITWKVITNSCSTSIETVDIYETPKEGTLRGSTQYLYTAVTTASADNAKYQVAFTNLDDWNPDASDTKDASTSPNLLDYAFLLPGSTMPVRKIRNGNLSTVTNATALLGYARNINGPSMAGVIWTESLVKKVVGTRRVSLPPEDTQVVLASNSGTTPLPAASEFSHSTFSYGEGNVLCKLVATGQWSVQGLNANITVYKDGSIEYGWVSALLSVTPVDYGEEDIEYYYPPERDWLGEEYIASIASTDTPTEAQRVVKIDPIEGTTQYNVYFEDGHTTLYNNTQAIYNGSKYYTTLQGIAEAYIDFNFEKMSVTYNITDRDVTIGSDKVKVTRYTGVVAGANAFVTYEDTNFTNPVLRNNTASMVYDDGTSEPLGYSTAWIYKESASGTTQEPRLPNISGIIPGSLYVVGTGNVSGCFATPAVVAFALAPGALGTYYFSLNMNASRSSSIYSSVQEVRPKNYTIRIWVRTE